MLHFATGLALFGASRFDQKVIITIGTFGCGYTTDPKKNCNESHRAMQAVKADTVKDFASNGFAKALAHVKDERPKSMAVQMTNKEI